MNKILVFDMDGTIADLYGVENWLDDLIAKRVRPYAEAKPIYDMDTLVSLLDILKSLGWRVAITSWLAKNSNADYDKKVADVKKAWLDRFDFPYDILNIVPYGTDKSSVTAIYGGYQILLDDEEKNLNDWKNGLTFNAKNDIINMLIELIEKEV